MTFAPIRHATTPSIFDGVINLHKPVGITSAKALYRVRSITGQRKSGHAGTLDPAASGVLLLCLGKATRLVESMMNLPKVYRATGRLDVTSESFDSDRPLIPVSTHRVPTREEVLQVCSIFEGTIEQVPPRISAIKIGGVPSYKRAVGEDETELAPRVVQVYWLVVHRYEWPTIDFEVCCGRGTYIRALIRDIGGRLGAGGCLTSLVRSRVGPFKLDEAWSLEALYKATDSEGPRQVDDLPYGYLIDLERVRTMVDSVNVVVPERASTAKAGHGPAIRPTLRAGKPAMQGHASP